MRRTAQVVFLVVGVAALTLCVTIALSSATNRSCEAIPRYQRFYIHCIGVKGWLQSEVRALRGSVKRFKDDVWNDEFPVARYPDSSSGIIEMCSGDSVGHMLGGRGVGSGCWPFNSQRDDECLARDLEIEQHAIEAEWADLP
jgi:hypothetical protein